MHSLGTHGFPFDRPNRLFEEIMVWRRLNDGCAARYACLRELGANRYAIQSIDYFHLPVQDDVVHLFQRQFAELVIDSAEDRKDWFDTLDAAITAFDDGCW